MKSLPSLSRWWHDGTAYLYLLKGDFEAETLVEVRIQRVFLHRRLFLLDPFAILLQNNLHIRILNRRRGDAVVVFWVIRTKQMFK